jgi:hypothetical protein
MWQHCCPSVAVSHTLASLPLLLQSRRLLTYTNDDYCCCTTVHCTLQVIELNSDTVLFRADAGAPDDTSATGDAPTAGPTPASTAGATEFANLTDFVRAWSSRFAVKCETSHLIDSHVLRWQAS